MYRGIIFDLDGVICSTDEYHYLAWKELADRLKIPFDREINKRLRGISRMESLAIILEKSSVNYTEKNLIQLAEEKNTTYKKMLLKMTPMDLAEDVSYTLHELKKQGYKLAIGSSSKNAKIILKQLGLGNFFDAVSDGTNISNSKPDPEVFLKAAEFIRELPENCLVVEDAAAGIIAASRGGFASAGIGDATLVNGVTYKIAKVSDLITIVEGKSKNTV